MIDYDWLYGHALQRLGTSTALENWLPQPASADELAARGNDRYLSAITQRVFRAGMTHAVVDARWPAFEEAFWGFVPEKMVLLSAEQIEAHMRNPALIRHMTKLRTIPHNAQMILDTCLEQDKSFGAFIAAWPATDITGLWRFLAQRGSRLGGRSAAGFLRMVGKDTFLLTSDVVARLVAAGVVTGNPTSQRDLRAVQGAFNRLHDKSARPLCQLSAMLALTINPRF